MEPNPRSTFDHEFEGYSVWLEPCPNDAKDIIKAMQNLSVQCGGSKSGTHPFALHCTLLYNFNPDRLIPVKVNNDNNGDKEGIMNHEELGLKMLESCVEQYKDSIVEKLRYKMNPTDSSSYNQNNNQKMKIDLNPTDFYFFPYPKHADDGRGFGCVISMLLLEKNENLELIQQIVSEIFPPDERHGKNQNTITNTNSSSGSHDADSKVKEENDEELNDTKKEINTNDGRDDTQSYHDTTTSSSSSLSSSSSTTKTTKSTETKGNFIPHMALVYAPEIYHDSLKTTTQQIKEEEESKSTNAFTKPLQAKYLSLWSTKGKLQDWKLICRVDLENLL